MVCVSVVLANGIIWTLAMIFTHGILDVNALFNQSHWKYGEGWFEAALFAVISIYGFIILNQIKGEIK